MADDNEIQQMDEGESIVPNDAHRAGDTAAAKQNARPDQMQVDGSAPPAAGAKAKKQGGKKKGKGAARDQEGDGFMSDRDIPRKPTAERASMEYLRGLLANYAIARNAVNTFKTTGLNRAINLKALRLSQNAAVIREDSGAMADATASNGLDPKTRIMQFTDSGVQLMPLLANGALFHQCVRDKVRPLILANALSDGGRFVEELANVVDRNLEALYDRAQTDVAFSPFDESCLVHSVALMPSFRFLGAVRHDPTMGAMIGAMSRDERSRLLNPSESAWMSVSSYVKDLASVFENGRRTLAGSTISTGDIRALSGSYSDNAHSQAVVLDSLMLLRIKYNRTKTQISASEQREVLDLWDEDPEGAESAAAKEGASAELEQRWDWGSTKRTWITHSTCLDGAPTIVQTEQGEVRTSVEVVTIIIYREEPVQHPDGGTPVNYLKGSIKVTTVTFFPSGLWQSRPFTGLFDQIGASKPHVLSQSVVVQVAYSALNEPSIEDVHGSPMELRVVTANAGCTEAPLRNAGEEGMDEDGAARGPHPHLRHGWYGVPYAIQEAGIVLHCFGRGVPFTLAAKGDFLRYEKGRTFPSEVESAYMVARINGLFADMLDDSSIARSVMEPFRIVMDDTEAALANPLPGDPPGNDITYNPGERTQNKASTYDWITTKRRPTKEFVEAAFRHYKHLGGRLEGDSVDMAEAMDATTTPQWKGLVGLLNMLLQNMVASVDDLPKSTTIETFGRPEMGLHCVGYQPSEIAYTRSIQTLVYAKIAKPIDASHKGWNLPLNLLNRFRASPQPRRHMIINLPRLSANAGAGDEGMPRPPHAHRRGGVGVSWADSETAKEWTIPSSPSVLMSSYAGASPSARSKSSVFGMWDTTWSPPTPLSGCDALDLGEVARLSRDTRSYFDD